MQTVKKALNYGKNLLKSANIDSFSIDASILLMESTGLSKTELATKESNILSDDEYNAYLSMLNQRCHHKPVQYIIKRCEFMSLEFSVDERALIPRPDTEILTEELLRRIKLLQSTRKINILEIGTGSGCILISVVKHSKNVKATAVDISPASISLASLNAKKHGISIEFIESNLFDNIPAAYENCFDIIFSNPPYIKDSVIDTLEASVKDYEPLTALKGGEDGLYFYREISRNSKKFLKNQGVLMFEIGYDQNFDVRQILESEGFKDIKTLKDLPGHDRVVSCALYK